jgi:hypothetical protein
MAKAFALIFHSIRRKELDSEKQGQSLRIATEELAKKKEKKKICH